ILYCLHSSADHLVFQSFPTRRSSDLIELLMHYGIEPESTTIPSAWWSKEPGTVTISITDQPTARSLVVRNMGAAGVNETMLLIRSEEHTSELQSRENLVCRLLLEKKK